MFCRRVYLDIVGLLPTVEEFSRFVQSSDPDKRAKLIDELLDRKEFVEIWVNKWAELLQVRTVPNEVSYKGMFLYYNWLVEKLSKNTPMDEMVQELLGATGGTFKSPATNFYQGTKENMLFTENVAQVFMGMRIQCAQCHNHPFDRWTQNDYYGFSAFFSQIGRKQAEDYREIIVFNAGGGEVRHPVGGRVMKPKFLGGIEPDTKGKDRRVVLAEWLASKDNPWFATSFANRVWAHFFGLGIVEPVDDFRVSNPASNPELLEELGKRFTASKYDLKKLVRDICNSRTYQRSTHRNPSNESDEKNFAHANLRRIKAENLLDVISQATDTKDKFQRPADRRTGRADRRRQLVQLFPHHLRPRHPRDRLLVRGEDGADALAGAPPHERAYGQREDRFGRGRQEADDGEEIPRGTARRPVFADPRRACRPTRR